MGGEAVYTGDYIFNEIESKMKELKELNEALGMIGDDMGTDCIPYRIVKGKYDEVNNALKLLKERKYRL